MAAAKQAVPSDIAARTIRKVRNRLIPLLFLLYLIAFLDRTNIGFAALTMNADLGITSVQFGLLTGIFFWGYCLFEIPSNLILHRVGARTWIARILVSWGIVAVLTGFVHSANQLYVMRFLLGVAEAGFFPGILLYLTYWFRRNEQAQMIALFMVAIPVSNIIGAPVSGFILDHVYWLAIASWRWLLMLEGLPAIIGGVVTYLLLPSRPIEARFLSAREKDWIMNAIADEQSRKMGGRLSALRVLAHGRVWHLACVSLAFNIGSYAFIFWMPQAARLLSKLYSNTTVGMLVMIPYLAGLAAMILVSRSSDRKRERRYHVAIPSMLTGIALLSLGATSSPLLSTALWSLAYIGIAGATAPLFSIPCDLLGGAAAASGIALFNSIGSLGGFFGSSLVGAAADRQGGIYRGLAMAAVSFFVLAVLILMLPKRSSGLRAAQA